MSDRTGNTWVEPHVRARLVLVAAFVVARLALVGWFLVNPFDSKGIALSDLVLYDSWVGQLVTTGSVPSSELWMYPPAAAVLLAVVGDLPLLYFAAFLAFSMVLDVGVLIALLIKGDHIGGTWVWAILPPVLGVVAWSRLDMFPVAATVVSLLWAASRPGFAGVMAALGAAVKVWPALLGLLLLRNRAWLTAALVTGGGIVLLSLLAPDAWQFVARLAQRGLQVESVPATPWLVAGVLEGRVDGATRNGTYEIVAAGAQAMARLASVLSIAAVVAAWWLTRGRPPALRWWLIVLSLLCTSPLLSTQFLLWVVGATAVAAAAADDSGRLVRRTVPLLAVILLLTHLMFPGQWESLTGTVLVGDRSGEAATGGASLASLTLVCRNVALLGLTVWAWVLVLRYPPETVEAVHRPVAPPRGRPVATTKRRG